MIVKYLKPDSEGRLNMPGCEIHEEPKEGTIEVQIDCTDVEYRDTVYANMCRGGYLVQGNDLVINPDYTPG